LVCEEELNLPLENSYRRFLLGIASEEDEQRAEEAILAGALDAAEIGILEDGLIDDYVFGDLSPDEELAFGSHFLSTDERRRKLAFTRALMHFARKQPSSVHETREDSSHRQGRRITLPWPRVAITALVAAILLACLVGFQQVLLHRQTQLSQNAQNEIARLQGALTDRDSGPRIDPVQEPYFVFPRRTRDPLHPPVLHISPQASLVRLNLNLISPSTGTYAVELYKDGRQLWTQMLDVSQLDQRTIVLQTNLLTSGTYLIQFKNSDPLVQQTFRVERN
jgi:hypothetical protein